MLQQIALIMLGGHSHSVHLPFCWGAEPSTKFSKGGGLDRTSTLRGGNFFQVVGCNFYKKTKLKSEILNGKKIYKQKIFFCHN